MPPVTATRCPHCGWEWRTRANGYRARCMRCNTSHYVPRVTTDSLADRVPVGCTCSRCGHQWQSRARSRSAIRCPECRHSVWVPQRTGSAPSPADKGPTGRRFQVLPGEPSGEQPDEYELDGDQVDDEYREEQADQDRAELRRNLAALLEPRAPIADPPAARTSGNRRRPGRTPTGQQQTRRAVIRGDWATTPGQRLIPRPAPPGTPACRHCAEPGTYRVMGPLFPDPGAAMCWVHAEQERYGPDTRVSLLDWR